MNLKKISVAICLLLATQFGQAQDGIPVYSDYFADNLYLLHPSMAGAASSGQIRLTARQQWFDQQNAPNLQTLAANMRLAESSGVGVIAFNDQNGFHSQVGMYFTYAHHLKFSRTDVDLNQLSFGLTAGIVQSRLDETGFDLINYPDPIVAGIVQSASYFNVDLGMSYNLMDFSTHFTVKNLIFQNRDIYSEDFESTNQRRYMLSAAYTFGRRFRSDWYYEPSILFQYVERTEEAGIDVNFKAFRNMDFGKIWGGLSYRTSFDGAEYYAGSVQNQRLQYISPVIGVDINNFMFAYTYSYQAGNVNFSNSGFHQITLGYNFMRRKQAYDCNCPAIN